jgi:hypothetical protein
MRENRPYGLEGGESGSTGLPYPYPAAKQPDLCGRSTTSLRQTTAFVPLRSSSPASLRLCVFAFTSLRLYDLGFAKARANGQFASMISPLR